MVSVAEVLTAEYMDGGRRACWLPYLGQEFNRPYMRRLHKQLMEDESKGLLLPKPECIFEALDETTPEEVKVVIVGEAPYTAPGQAHGLAFSTKHGKRPKSLSNIFAEVRRNMNQHGRAMAKDHNCLTPWARQGVLLLNRALTVGRGHAGAHIKGWERFTEKVIETINVYREHVVFMLWGDTAKEARHVIDADRHMVLCWQHPKKGLRGSEHFSQANQYLQAHGTEPIDWLDVCGRPRVEERNAVRHLTSVDADDEARWDRAFANSIRQLDRLAAEAAQERRSGRTEELDPSRL